MPVAVGEKPVLYTTAPFPLLDEIYTAEEVANFPTDWHYELIEGYLRPMPMPTGDAHGSYTALFSAFTTLFIVEHGLGDVFAAETGFLIREQPDTIKAPDFAFVAKGRLPSTRTQRFVKVVPDLILETRSPSDREVAVKEKIQEWLAAGVQVALDLDPAKERVTVYRPHQEPLTLSAEDSFTAEELLPRLFTPATKGLSCIVSATSKTLLLIADDLLLSSRVREGAKAAEYTVITAATQEAAKKAATNDPRPNVILVSLNARRCDAYAVIRDLKSDPTTTSLPILAFAGHAEREKHVAARAAGADLVAANSSVSMHLSALLTRLRGGETGIAAEEEESAS